MNIRHYSALFADGTSTGAYAAGPQDALEQIYAEDVNGDQPEVIIVWETEKFGRHFAATVDHWGVEQ